MPKQNLRNHTKFVPAFHFFALPLLAANFVRSIVVWWQFGRFAVGNLIYVGTALALLVGLVSVRLMVMKVQDRVIRLEERLRLERLLPADLQARIPEFTLDQLVALRFASNAELPELAHKVLDEKIQQRKAIKRMIKTWRPDLARA